MNLNICHLKAKWAILPRFIWKTTDCYATTGPPIVSIYRYMEFYLKWVQKWNLCIFFTTPYYPIPSQAKPSHAQTKPNQAVLSLDMSLAGFSPSFIYYFLKSWVIIYREEKFEKKIILVRTLYLLKNIMNLSWENFLVKKNWLNSTTTITNIQIFHTTYLLVGGSNQFSCQTEEGFA